MASGGNVIRFTQEEIQFVKDNYLNMTNEELAMKLGRSVSGMIKIKKENNLQILKTWTDKEKQYLIDNYNMLTDLEIAKNLNKSIDGIKCKAQNLGIRNKSKTIQWSNKQLEILKNSSNKTIKEISNLVGLDEDVVHRKMNKLKLPFVKYGRNQTREQLLDKTNIKHYKERNGIILDKEKVFDTYTEEEWVDMYIDKRISSIPKPIYEDKDKYFKCLKYFISKFIDINNRDNILNLDSHFKPKGFTLIQNYAFKNYSSVNDFLIELFPEYNIKQWEFKMVKKQYFDVIDNIKEYITHVICNELQCDINNCCDYIKYFTDGNLANLGYARIIHIKKSRKFKNYYDLLHTLYGDIIKEEYFNYWIASDGTQLDSSEELLVYEFIKSNISEKVKATNRSRKNGYTNNGEMYIPDFSIPCQDKNKKIIIEYFGLYDERYQQYERIKIYTDKAKRKIEYFKSLKDVLFVDLYREDLKNNFEGVRNKLTSFIV